jgi:hypothetical protein
MTVSALPTVMVVCAYVGENGISHLADVALPGLHHMVDADGLSHFSGMQGATEFGFVVGAQHGQSDWGDWHVSGTPGLSIVLSGAWEIEAGSGQRRLLDTGSVLLMLDNHGQGHRSRTPDGKPCTVLGVGIDEATQLAYAALIPSAIPPT